MVQLKDRLIRERGIGANRLINRRKKLDNNQSKGKLRADQLLCSPGCSGCPPGSQLCHHPNM